MPTVAEILGNALPYAPEPAVDLEDAALTGATTAEALVVSGAVSASSMLITGKALRTAYQIETPASGATVVVGAAKSDLKLFPAALIAALTVTLPASPSDGQLLRISSSQAITALTVNGGNVFPAPPTTIAAGGSYELQYWAGGTTWLNGF